MYDDSYMGKGDGHSLIDQDGNLVAADYSFENFKKTYETFYKDMSGKEHSVNFQIDNSFRNKPITYLNHVFLSEEKYLEEKDKIIDYLKTRAGVRIVTLRGTSIANYEDADFGGSELLPNNIKNIFSSDELSEISKNEKRIIFVYDRERFDIGDGYSPTILSKKDLRTSSEEDYKVDKSILGNNAFSFWITNDSSRDVFSNPGRLRTLLPKNFYFNREGSPVYIADSNLKFKEKSKIFGSEYYISSTSNDADTFLENYYAYLKKHDLSNVDPSELNEEWEQMKEELIPYINEVHKNDKDIMSKYRNIVGPEKWGDQRLTQYVGNVDTKVEEKDFKVIKKEDPTLEEGKTKVETKGVKGKKVTKITYKVNRVNGELTDPIEEVVEDVKPVNEVVLVGTKKVTPAKPIEDIATKTTKEDKEIPFKTKYVADASMEFAKTKVFQEGQNGIKEVTTISKVVDNKRIEETSEVVKTKATPKIISVGNRQVEVKNNDDGSVTTTTTIYDVDPNTGELVNPRSTSKTVMDAKLIEDNAKTTQKAKEVIKAKVVYESDDSLTFEEKKVIKTPVDGEKEITTVSQKGKEDVVTEKTLKDPEDGLTKVGNKKVEVKNNDDGSVTTTTTIYDVDPNTGELVNPKSTSKTVMDVKLIEDNAKTTKKAKEVIKAKVVYESDDSLTFEEKKVIKTPVDGEKEITTVSQKGKKDVVTEDIIKPAEDGKTRVGNKKIEVKNNDDGSTTTTTTIYDVDPNTGELVNPRSTSKTTMPAKTIGNIAKPIENTKPKVSTPAKPAPTRTSVKAQTGGSVGAIGGLIAGLTAAAGSIFKRRKK